MKLQRLDVCVSWELEECRSDRALSAKYLLSVIYVLLGEL